MNGNALLILVYASGDPNSEQSAEAKRFIAVAIPTSTSSEGLLSGLALTSGPPWSPVDTSNRREGKASDEQVVITNRMYSVSCMISFNISKSRTRKLRVMNISQVNKYSCVDISYTMSQCVLSTGHPWRPRPHQRACAKLNDERWCGWGLLPAHAPNFPSPTHNILETGLESASAQSSSEISGTSQTTRSTSEKPPASCKAPQPSAARSAPGCGLVSESTNLTGFMLEFHWAWREQCRILWVCLHPNSGAVQLSLCASTNRSQTKNKRWDWSMGKGLFIQVQSKLEDLQRCRCYMWCCRQS